MVTSTKYLPITSRTIDPNSHEHTYLSSKRDALNITSFQSYFRVPEKRNSITNHRRPCHDSGGYSPVFHRQARHLLQARPCGICGERKSGFGTGYQQVLPVSPVSINLQMHLSHSFTYHRQHVFSATDSISQHTPQTRSHSCPTATIWSFIVAGRICLDLMN